MKLQLAIGLLLISGRLASSQPASAQAQVLFDQGITLMDQSRFGEACAAFDASDKLEPAISTLLNRADCREKNNQLTSAWGLFLDAERQTRAATDEPTRQLHLVAIDHAARLEPRLSKLTVNVPTQSKLEGLEIRRGNDLIDVGAWNHPLPVDGGKYTITARAPNHDAWTTTIEVSPAHDNKSVEVAPLKLTPVIAPPRRAKLPFMLAGAAVALLGTGLGLELSAESTYSKSKVEPDDMKQASLWQSANHRRYAAEGFAAGGMALAAVAVWRFMGHSTIESDPRIGVLPTVASNTTGLQVFGRF
jgi:hypothetical protein